MTLLFSAIAAVSLQVQAIPPPPISGRGDAPSYHEGGAPQGEKSIVIDLATQTLTAYEFGAEVHRFKCSTGRNNATPKGEWPIRQKLRYNTALPEFGSVPIPFSLRLDIVKNGRRRRIAIHAHKNVPDYPASHGCIRLRYPDAETLFGWASVGIVVSIR
jgi:lipoprotein-anchoring transpeptidase ErfK/SrfK